MGVGKVLVVALLIALSGSACGGPSSLSSAVDVTRELGSGGVPCDAPTSSQNDAGVFSAYKDLEAPRPAVTQVTCQTTDGEYFFALWQDTESRDQTLVWTCGALGFKGDSTVPSGVKDVTSELVIGENWLAEVPPSGLVTVSDVSEVLGGEVLSGLEICSRYESEVLELNAEIEADQLAALKETAAERQAKEELEAKEAEEAAQAAAEEEQRLQEQRRNAIDDCDAGVISTLQTPDEFNQMTMCDDEAVQLRLFNSEFADEAFAERASRSQSDAIRAKAVASGLLAPDAVRSFVSDAAPHVRSAVPYGLDLEMEANAETIRMLAQDEDVAVVEAVISALVARGLAYDTEFGKSIRQVACPRITQPSTPVVASACEEF